MTRGSKTPILPPLEDLKPAFHKKKGKKGASSNTFKSEKFELFERTPDKKEIGYDPKTSIEESSDEEEIKSKVEEIVDITRMTMGDYKKRIREEYGPGLVPPEILSKRSFELKGHILSMLKDIPFAEREYEDAFKHIDEVKDIDKYFNVPNVPREVVLLRMLPVIFISETKVWLKSLALGSIIM